MVNGVNGFNQNILDYHNKNINNTNNSKKESEWMKDLNKEELKTVEKINRHMQESFLKYKDNNLQAGQLSLSGYSLSGKISIWGKMQGLDSSLSDSEVNELNNFVRNHDMLYINDYFSLLDSDLEIDEFKKHWLELSQKAKNDIEQNLNNKPQNTINTDEAIKFNPIQSLSKNTQTYDINKDTKFAYQRELLKREQERGIDVLHLMQKLEENGKKVVDKII